MEYSWEYVPDWFVWFTGIITVSFIGVSQLLTRGKVNVTRKVDGVTETKASYTEHPLKVMTKRAEIFDMKVNYVGYVRRNFDNIFQMLVSLVMPNYFVDVSSEDGNRSTNIRILKLREKKDLLQSRWEGTIVTNDSEEKFLLKGDRRLMSNSILSFPYKDEIVNVSKNVEENTIYFYKNGKQIGLISIKGKLPPRRIFIDAQEGELPKLLLACIFEIIKYYK